MKQITILALMLGNFLAACSTTPTRREPSGVPDTSQARFERDLRAAQIVENCILRVRDELIREQASEKIQMLDRIQILIATNRDYVVQRDEAKVVVYVNPNLTVVEQVNSTTNQCVGDTLDKINVLLSR